MDQETGRESFFRTANLYLCGLQKGMVISMTLDKLPVGSSAVITAVGGEGALRLRLLDMGIIPHTKVRVEKIAPMGDPIEIQIRGYELTLRMDDASKISVEPDKTGKGGTKA